MNDKLSKYIKSNRLRVSTQVFIIGIVLSATFFLLFIDAFKTYTSSMTILVNPKSGSAISQSERILGNIVELSHTLSFYDRMLKNNPDVRDVAAELNQDQRKKVWNSMLSTKIVRDSSVIKISITAQRENDSDQLVQKTVRNLFDVTGAYYNIKDDIDLRIIDGPISESNLNEWYLLLPLSLILGFAIALLLQYILLKSRGIFVRNGRQTFPEEKMSFDFKKENQKHSEQKISSLEDLYKAEEVNMPYFQKKETEDKIPEVTPQIKEMKRVTKMIQQNKYPNFPEMPFPRGDQKSGAPDNLPVGDDLFFSQSQKEKKDGVEKDNIFQNEQKTEAHREPTEEELKERLNQLLRGDFRNNK